MRDNVLLLAAALAASVAGNAAYRQLAIRFGIVARPNERSLHQGAIPRGGGVVVILVFLVGVAGLFAAGELPRRFFFALAGGGALIGLVGFVDDVAELSTRARVIAHALAGAWAAYWAGADFLAAVGWAGIWPGYVAMVVAVMWMINLFNFMDGIDGMEASGVVWFSIASVAIIVWRGGSPHALPIALLGLASAGFLFFNWPPARMFLGDAGSGAFGYLFSVFALATVAGGAMSIWTWIILLGYFIGDTGTTLAIRLRTVKKWWGTHRSHAYQNLARVWRDHRRMTLLVLAVQVAWLTPLALVSATWVELGPVLALVALAPIVGFTIKYGPLYGR